ncbi:MAG: hypothetical protein FJ119_08310 [Deltaproteobacteria bacterium]|nr:hypothetical protein [Deltaproteobacteria bacterium]
MKLIDFIICDDIRQEIGGKVTLVGVYEDRIMINAPSPDAVRWPVQLKLGFFIRLLNDGSLAEVDGFDLQVRCNAKMICRLSGPISIPPRQGLLNLFFVNSAVRIPSEGTLSVALIFKKGADGVHEIRPDLNIQVRIASSSAAPPPLQVTRH